MERVLGTRVVHTEAKVGKGNTLVVYEIATLGVQEEKVKERAAKFPIPDLPETPPVDPGGEQGMLF